MSEILPAWQGKSPHLQDVVSREVAVVQREFVRNDWNVAVSKLFGYLL